MLVSVLAIIRCAGHFVKDVELYCQRITNEKMRSNFLSHLLNKHGSNRVMMNISLNDLDYDSDKVTGYYF